MVEIKIDKEKCVGCNNCIDSCPVNLYTLNDGKAVVSGNIEDCVLCRACEATCPVSAIEIIE